MEIKVKKPNSVLIVGLLNILPKTFAMFVGFFIAAFVIALILSTNSYVGLIFTVIFVIPPMIFLVYQILNLKSFAAKSMLKMSENSVEVISGNLTANSNIHVPFGQIRSTSVSQNFYMKIFNLGGINIIDEGDVITSLWGFNKTDADDFCRTLSEKSQERIQLTNK